MSAETSASSPPPPPGTGNIWRIFISYRRSELTTGIARWLKQELDRETLVSTTGQVFSLDVFVDAAEPHRPDFQANLVPRLRHSRALIVLADEGAAARRDPPLMDYLYEELDWWAKERRSAPPILLQLDKSALKLVDDSALVRWRKVNFLPCWWELWSSRADGGETEKARLLSQVRESIRTYGEIVHLEEVRRLRRRAYIAAAFAVAALAGALVSYRQSQESQRQRERAEGQTAIAQSESNAAALAAAHFASTSGDLLTARNWLDGIDPKQRAWEWFYLRGLTDTATATFRQTDKFLGSRIRWELYEDRRFAESKLDVVASSRDGSLIAAGSDFGRLLLWDASTGKRLYDDYVSKGIRSLAFDPDGGGIAVGSLDGSLLLFNVKAKTTAKLSQEEGVVGVVLYTAPSRLVSAAWNGSITIWDTEHSSKMTRYVYPEAAAEIEKMEEKNDEEFKRNPLGLGLFDDSRQVIKLTGDFTVRDRMFHLRPIGSSFLRGVPAADGHSLWAEMGDGIFRVDLRTWKKERLTAGGRGLSELSLLSGIRPVVVQRELVKQGPDYFEGRTLNIWEPGRPDHKVDGRKLGVSAHVLALSPDGKRVAVSFENRVDVYRFYELSLEQRLTGHDAPVKDAAFLASSRLVTASEDGHVKIWDLDHQKLKPSIQAHSRPVTAVAFRTFGGEQFVISASEDGTIKSFDLLSQNSPSVLFRQKQAIRSIALSDDAKRLAVVCEGGVAIIELDGAVHPPKILNISNAVAVSFDKNRDHLLVAVEWRKEGVSFRLIDAVTGKVLANERKDERPLFSHEPVMDVRALTRVPLQDAFAWASDSRMGVGHAGFGTVSTLDWGSGLKSDYDSVAVSADGSLGAFGARTGEIEVRSTPGVPWRSIGPLRGHLRAVTGLAFTSSWTRLISGSEDGSIRIWDLIHQRELLLIRTGSGVRSVAISPDGRTLAAGLADGTLRFWDAPGAPPN